MVRISPLYLHLLARLCTSGYMRTDQIERMLRVLAAREQTALPAKSLRRVVQKRLLAMVNAGILRRIIPPVFPHERKGPPFYIYTLDKAGAALVAEHLGEPVQELGWQPGRDESQLFLNHTLQTVNTHILLAEACLRRGIELAEWVDDRILRKEPARVTLAGHDGEVRVSVIPDAYYRLKSPDGAGSLTGCLEVDMATATVMAGKWQVRSFRRKVLAYRQLMAEEHAGTLWDARSAIVTTITTSAARMAHLKQVCEDAGGDHHFWFSTFYALRADTILTAPVWFVAGKGDKQFRLLRAR